MKIKVVVNPHSRTTVRIPEHIYKEVRKFIVEALISKKEITLNNLLLLAQENSSLPVREEVSWYVLKVKQDLEARRLICVKRSVGLEREQVITLIKSKIKRLSEGY